MQSLSMITISNHCGEGTFFISFALLRPPGEKINKKQKNKFINKVVDDDKIYSAAKFNDTVKKFGKYVILLNI